MNAKKFVWSAENESVLIDLIRERPALWDPADENYTKKTYKKILYEHVAEEMGRRWPEEAGIITGTFVQMKFNSLRSYFQREERKVNSASGAGFVFLPKWVHFQRLTFLKDPPRETPSETTLEISFVKSEAQSPFSISESQLDEEASTSLPIEADTCTVEGEDVETGPTSKRRKETRSSLPVEDTCTAETEDLETGAPRKRRETEGEAFAPSAFQSSQCQPSVSASIAQMVHATLTNLTPEDGSQCAQEIFGVVLKYIKNPTKLNCTK
ncbi:hypothetical protein AVEN_99797-1 [Araneus ventricosus]|uniref:MADF domain-containing protein n=1 Tax=Araneus ventricosus TaxID=182803 RepID=A0A4Y2KX57_ARAVE|nr:hypothetical protein AVEN_99797-1 [Araneus ventricosus]